MKQIKIQRENIPMGNVMNYFIVLNYEREHFIKYVEEANYPMAKDAVRNISISPTRMYYNPPRNFNLDAFLKHPSTTQIGEKGQIIPIGNGEILNLKISDEDTTIFIALFGTSGFIASEQLIIPRNSGEKLYYIGAKTSFTQGQIPTLSEVNYLIDIKKNNTPIWLMFGCFFGLIIALVLNELGTIASIVAFISVLGFVVGLIWLIIELISRSSQKKRNKKIT